MESPKKWINKHIQGAEWAKTVEGRAMVFIPVKAYEQLQEHLNRVHYSPFKMQYAGNYEWLQIIF
jgi:hypothetical protein